MITYTCGDIFDCETDTIVNPVNCVGVMGKGLALQFKQRFPDNFTGYKQACDHKELVIGSLYVHERGEGASPRIIINFPTKRHWKEQSRLEDIQAGLTALIHAVRNWRIQSIAIPPLGCGLGGLEWKDVRPLVEEAARFMPNTKVICICN